MKNYLRMVHIIGIILFRSEFKIKLKRCGVRVAYAWNFPIKMSRKTDSFVGKSFGDKHYQLMNQLHCAIPKVTVCIIYQRDEWWKYVLSIDRYFS